jgi:16S rRNA C1402 (ribose-2'-O) methylase RsmI
MHKNNVGDLLEIKGFNHHKINQRLDLIKSKLDKSGIAISLNDERKLEKILNKIANDQANIEDINFCKELCKFSNDNQENNCQENIEDEKQSKLSNKIKNENQQINSDEITFENNLEILRQSMSFNDLRQEIIKNTFVYFKNDNYFLSYQISKNNTNKLSFRIKFSDNKCTISFYYTQGRIMFLSF